MPGPTDFFVNQGNYERIVKIAKSLPTKPGVITRSDISGRTVWVNRDRSGLYTVTIRTKDYGHSGDYGYTYSDAILDSKPHDIYPQQMTLPGSNQLPFVKQKMNAHWWSVYNDLN
jgi:hypothetical protein